MVDPIMELCKTLEPYSLEWWIAGCFVYGTLALAVKASAVAIASAVAVKLLR